MIDKSTADSIACSDDVEASLPYPVDSLPWTPGNLNTGDSHQPIHPLSVLAVNLALVSKPGAHWICLSYSNDRFNLSEWSTPSYGFPKPGLLWKVVNRCEIKKATPMAQDETSDAPITHRPKIVNWVYILERTEVPLYVQGAQE